MKTSIFAFFFTAVLSHFTLKAQISPDNDVCSQPQAIALQCPGLAFLYPTTTQGANQEVVNATCENGQLNDVWFVFNAGVNTSIQCKIVLETAANIGGELYSLCGTPASGVLIDGVSGQCMTSSAQDATHIISGLIPNTTYLLRFYTNVSSGTAGTFSFWLTGNEMIATNAAVSTGDYVWQGLSNSDISITSNWLVMDTLGMTEASALPDSSRNIVIPGLQTCVFHQPTTLGYDLNCKDLYIDETATLQAGSGTIFVNGNWHSLGMFDAGSGTVTFRSTQPANLFGSDTVNFFKLRMNNSGDVNLQAPVNVHNQLIMTLGDINLGIHNLHLHSSVLTGGTGMSYVRTNGTGSLYRNLVDTMLYPVGRATFNSVKMIKSGSPFPFGARVVDAVSNDGIDTGIVWNIGNVGRMWHVTPGSGYEPSVNGSVTLTLSYLSEANYFANFFSNFESDRQMMHFNGNGWENITNVNGAFTTGINTLNYVWCTQSGVSDFSPFTVANEFSGLSELLQTNPAFFTYPNPSSGSFFVKSELTQTLENKIEIINAMGQVVYENSHVGSSSIQCHLVPGVYTIRMMDATGQSSTSMHIIQ
jgi:hypothetical protein